MTMHDLAKYHAIEREPTHVTYRGLDVYSMGPPSSGGSTVGEALNILEGYNLASMTRDAGVPLLPRGVALRVRGPQRSTSPIPTTSTCRSSGLLSKDYAATRRALIKTTAANPPVVQPGNPYPFVTGQEKGHGKARRR